MARTSFEFPQGYSIYMEGERDEAVGYWSFPTHPHTSGCVARSFRLSELIGAYHGPDLVIDFDANDTIIGVELF